MASAIFNGVSLLFSPISFKQLDKVILLQSTLSTKSKQSLQSPKPKRLDFDTKKLWAFTSSRELKLLSLAILPLNYDTTSKNCLTKLCTTPEKVYIFKTTQVNVPPFIELKAAYAKIAPKTYFINQKETLQRFCEKGDLLSFINNNIRTLTEENFNNITLQILEKVTALHKIGIAHGDLKLRNLAVAPQTAKKPLRVKIIDFGGSSDISISSEKKPRCGGTLGYIAPELLKNTQKPLNLLALDAFAVGQILFVLHAKNSMTSFFCKENLVEKNAYKKFLETASEEEVNAKHALFVANISNLEMASIIGALIRYNPAERMSVEEAFHQMQLLLKIKEEASLPQQKNLAALEDMPEQIVAQSTPPEAIPHPEVDSFQSAPSPLLDSQS